MAEYIELHCHSNYSFQEGASSVRELVGRAVELGYPALALTDHDNLCGAMEFAQKVSLAGLRAITGAELTVAQPTHTPDADSRETGGWWAYKQPSDPARRVARGLQQLVPLNLVLLRARRPP